MPRVGVNRGPQLGILLLLYQLLGQIGLTNIPPATLAAIVSLFFLRSFYLKLIYYKVGSWLMVSVISFRQF